MTASFPRADFPKFVSQSAGAGCGRLKQSGSIVIDYTSVAGQSCVGCSEKYVFVWTQISLSHSTVFINLVAFSGGCVAPGWTGTEGTGPWALKPEHVRRESISMGISRGQHLETRRFPATALVEQKR